MKATGIVRRLDGLGRLVIPKEIRKAYHLNEGDAIEFFVNDNQEIMICKYEHLESNKNEIRQMVQVFEKLFKVPLYFYGDDELVCVDEQFKVNEEIVEKLKTYHEQIINNVRLFDQGELLNSIMVFPLVNDSHWVGCFILLEKNGNEAMKQVLLSYTQFLQLKMMN